MMLGFRLLNCHIYLYVIGIVTSDTFAVYTFWTYFNGHTLKLVFGFLTVYIDAL